MKSNPYKNMWIYCQRRIQYLTCGEPESEESLSLAWDFTHNKKTMEEQRILSDKIQEVMKRVENA